MSFKQTRFNLQLRAVTNLKYFYQRKRLYSNGYDSNLSLLLVVVIYDVYYCTGFLKSLFRAY